MTDKQLLEQALEALKRLIHLAEHEGWERLDKEYEAITAIKQALAAPVQEPVAWWNRTKDTASTDPVNRHNPDCQALYTAPPAAPVQEPVWCNHCNGSGRMVRDPDIGTDQECFVCDGTGVSDATTPPAAQRQWVGLTDDDKLTVRRMPWETLGDLMDNIEAKLKEKNT